MSANMDEPMLTTPWWKASNGVEVRRTNGEVITHDERAGNHFHGNRGDAIAEWGARSGQSGHDPGATTTAIAAAKAEAVRTALDGAVLLMGDRGVTVYDDRDHYDAGTPAPLPIREWLARKADRLEQEA